jgi:uncharacterized BrkB/YihY/UPF0761 family membrane protein
MAEETDPELEMAVAESRLRALSARSKATLSRRKDAAASDLNRWRDRNVLVDIAVRVRLRDVSTAGAVISSAVAFRLFLFFVPTLLFLVGLAGFAAQLVDAKTVSDATGVTGTLAQQINTAFSQPGSTRWIATLAGLFGMLTAGRTLTRVLVATSSMAWGVPVQLKATVRAISAVIGILVAVALMASIVSRVQQSRGVAVAGMSLVAAFAVYAGAWLLLSLSLPRATTDPGAVLPGAAVFGGVMVAMQAVTQLYLPGRLDHASELYGAIGVTIATLGWFFLIGRSIVLAMVLDAVVFERVGSISTLFFALPLVRVLPRRSAKLRRFFDLDRDERRAADAAALSEESVPAVGSALPPGSVPSARATVLAALAEAVGADAAEAAAVALADTDADAAGAEDAAAASAEVAPETEVGPVVPHGRT